RYIRLYARQPERLLVPETFGYGRANYLERMDTDVLRDDLTNATRPRCSVAPGSVGPATVSSVRAGDSAEAASLPWRDTSLTPSRRVADLLARMTLEEKVGQLYGVWVGADASGEGVAPHQHELAQGPSDWHEFIANGVGQLTRPF